MKVLNGINLNLLLLFMAGLLFWSSLSATLPTLPVYIATTGASKLQIGLIMGSFAIGMFLFRPQCGVLADRRGRKIVLLIGMSVAAIAPLLYLSTKSMIILALIRVFHGISIAGFATGYVALVTDLAPASRRGEIMGYMSLVAPLGTAFGPALGGYLQAGFGNVILFSAAGALASFGFFCLLPLFNPPLVAQPTSKPVNQFREFWQLLSSPQVRIPAIILLIVGLTIGSVDTFVSLFIKSTGVNLNVGLFFTTAAISAFGVRLFAGRASDKYGRGLVITISLVFYVIDMFCIWSANNSASFLLGACMHGIAGGSTFPTISAMMADRAQPHERGKIFSVALMGFDLGLVSAGPLLGGISEYIGYRSMFGYVVLACILSTYIFLTQSNRNLPESLRFACGLGRDAFTLH